jgi:hypothetical protein
MDYTTNSGVHPVAAGFIFPILKPADIQICMAELGAELSQEELQDPAHHKEKLRKVFTFLVRCACARNDRHLCCIVQESVCCRSASHLTSIPILLSPSFSFYCSA